MSARPATPRLKKVPGHIVATVRAFGGFTLLTTRRHKIVYASPLAGSWLPREGDRLIQPELASAIDEAWSSRDQIVRACQVSDLGPFHEIVVQASVIESRWVLVSVTDRTDEVQAVQIRRDFVSNIGHELRTPVTSVALIGQALHSCADDPAAVEHFATRLDQVAVRLQRLADGMLVLARTEDGGSTPSRTRLKVADLVDRAVDQAMETARTKGVKLQIKKRVDSVVEGDEESLVVAVENLVLNAIHYSTKGSRVVVSTQVDQAENTVGIHVIDQGIGIAPEEQERVFERFYRTDQARSHRSGGTGLGLAIVKHTALAHGGSVEVDSQPGSGSTFTLTLPRADQPAVGAGPTDEDGAA